MPIPPSIAKLLLLFGIARLRKEKAFEPHFKSRCLAAFNYIRYLQVYDLWDDGQFSYRMIDIVNLLANVF